MPHPSVAVRPFTRRLVVLVLVLLVGAVAGSTAPAWAAGGIGIRPAQPSGSEPGWFLYTLSPGESREDRVLVFNDSDRTQELELAAVDSDISSVGAFALRGSDEPQSGVGQWITLSLRRLTLGAGERREVKFTIVLPPDVDVGEHAGAVTVTSVRTATSTPSGVATRVGARVYVTVPGQQVHRLKLTSFAAAPTQDQQGYDFTLTGVNEGNVTLLADARLRLGGIGLMNWTTLFRPYELSQQWHLPRGEAVGTSFRTVPKPMFGRLVAYASVTFDGEGGRQVVEAQPVVLVIVPWSQVVVALGIILGVVAIAAWGALRRRRRSPVTGWVSYTVAPGDTITALASAGAVDWRVLARANGLKPPYVLSGGQVLQVPPTAPKAMALPAVVPEAEAPGPVDESAALPVVAHAGGHRWFWGALFLGGGVLVAIALVVFVRSASELPDVSPNALLGNLASTQPGAPAEPLPSTTTPRLPEPTPPVATTTRPVQPDSVDRSTRILVLNGSGVAGEAGRFAAQLKAAGFTAVEAGNADTFTHRGLSIRYHPGQLAVAEAVAEVFTAGALEASTDAAAPVVVIIGGPNKETATSTPE